MEKQSVLSSKYDSGKLLIETFGRGKLSRYLEPNFSERNNFEREKMSKEQPTRNIPFQSHSKKGQTFKDKLLALDKQNDKSDSHQKNQTKQAPFEQIDEISQKINGIIRSISQSCKKRGISSSSKKTLDKCETVDRLHKLQDKYCNHASEKQFKVIDPKSIPLYKQQEMKSSQTREKNHKNDVRFSSFSKKSVKKYHEHNQSNHNQEEFDDINQRIQYINEKITRYEHKMAGYQETYKTNKKKNDLYYNEIKEDSRTKESMLKSSNMDIHTHSARDKEVKTKQRGKENMYFDKEGQLLSSRKEGFFHEKYQQLLKGSKKDQQNKELHESTKKEKITKSSKINQNDSRVLPIKKNPLHSKFQEDLKKKTSFLKSLIKQIALDQDFRHAKHMFGGLELFDEKSESESQKWFRLQQQLKSEGISLSIHEVKHIFMPRDDEIDPFMSVSQSHEELVYGVVFAYQTCEQHWKETIYHGWSFRELKESNFTSENIDRGKKGFISLQDLTFYINTQIDGFFRNRDLLLIFNRLGSKHHLKYKQIMDFLLTS